MKKMLQKIAAVTAFCGLALILSVATWVLVVDPDPHFVCHKMFFIEFAMWQDETTNDDWYPNVEGNQAKSLAVLEASVPQVIAQATDYCYVPGLRRNDSDDLILMYLSRPSRRTWHGDGHFLRLHKRWVVLNPQLCSKGESFAADWSENGEALSTSDFKRRLSHTLDYLQENNRPNWQRVVQEHRAFLETGEL